MRYTIDVLDGARRRVAVMTGLVSAGLRESINGAAILTLETVDRAPWEKITPGTGFLALGREPGDSQKRLFRVIAASKSRTGERISHTVTARGLIGDTADEIFAESRDCRDFTPSELMQLVLAHSAFTVGTVEISTPVPWARFEYESVRDCLARIASLTDGELSLDCATGSISLLARVGRSDGAALRYGLNLAGASRSMDTTGLANRIYAVGGGAPPLLTTGATASGGMAYTEDAASVALYGAREAALHEPTLEACENLVATPSLDGPFSGGLCVGWTNVSATVAEETSGDYRLHGRASQRVATNADGCGISQSVGVVPGRTYSLAANIFVISGTVRVKVTDGQAEYRRAEAVTGSGLATVRIENWKANAAAVTVKIVQEGAGAAEFVADSVQIAEGARVKTFTQGSNADILWKRATEELAARKAPAITYTVDIADLPAAERASGVEGIELGDTVTVIDRALGLDVATRVTERTVDLLGPHRVAVRLDNRKRTLADVLARVREAEEEGLRRLRAAMAEQSAAAETGSERLGFSARTVRFSGTVTASAWNAISWSAGTLRAGDAWYAITAGSAASLAGNAAHYFRFDRTSPTTFAHSTNPGDAEGEDRAPVFTVTVTSSPDPAQIHPPDLIRGS